MLTEYSPALDPLALQSSQQVQRLRRSTTWYACLVLAANRTLIVYKKPGDIGFVPAGYGATFYVA